VSQRRIKIIKIVGDSFQFFCFTRYSDRAMTKRFYRSKTEEIPINETMDIYKVCTELLDKYFEGGASTPISVRLTKLEPERNIQLDLFDDRKDKRQILGHTVDAIRAKFGLTSRAVSFTDAGTALKRENLVGGHLA